MKKVNEDKQQTYYIYIAYKILLQQIADKKKTSMKYVLNEMLNSLPSPQRTISEREMKCFKQNLNKSAGNIERYHKNDEGVVAFGYKMPESTRQKLWAASIKHNTYPSTEICNMLTSLYPREIKRIYKEYKLRKPIPRVIQKDWVPYKDKKKRFTVLLSSEASEILESFMNSHSEYSISESISFFIMNYAESDMCGIVSVFDRESSGDITYCVRMDPLVYQTLNDLMAYFGTNRVSTIEHCILQYRYVLAAA